MKKTILVFTFLFSILSFGQPNVGYTLIDKKIAAIPSSSSTSTDGIARYINANFKTENDKIRAVFYWTASNISYDVKNMFFDNSSQSPQEKIYSALKNRIGVCIHYAEVFNDITSKIGIKSYIIEGYTKQNGTIASLAHAWCAAKIDNKWFVFDPTWGSGALYNGKFVKKINDYYFKTEPSKIISSHIPFDYLWQFLNYPVTNQEFYDGKIQVDKTKKYFDFAAEIGKYDSLSQAEKSGEATKRIEKNGVKNKLISDYLVSKKKENEVLNQNINIEKLNAVTSEYNQAIIFLNDFINYRNKQFKPTLPDFEISKMIQTPKDILIKCQNDIVAIGSVGSQNSANVASLRKNIYDTLVQVEGHESFVKEYLGKSKIGRKGMFTKVSWFGIPLN